SSGTIADVAEVEMVRQLRRAIIERATVRFCYHTRHVQDGQSTRRTREADPYGLVHVTNAWHLVAYCHLRHDIRNFRLERMENLALLSHTFQRPPEFKLQERRRAASESIVVSALFDTEVARWVRESRSYYIVTEEDNAAGLIVTLQVRQESEILQWLLSW